MRRLKFKSRTVILTTCALLAVAGGAFAYFTGSGSGTAAESVGTSAPVTINPSLSPTTLYPGSSSTVTFTVTNSTSQSQHVGSITLSSIKACPSGDTWTPGSPGSCSNAGTEITTCEDVSTAGTNPNNTDFWMPSVTENQNFAAGASGAGTTNTGTLTMNNLTTAQDQCKGANLYLTFTSN